MTTQMYLSLHRLLDTFPDMIAIGWWMDIIMFSKATTLSAEWKNQAHRHSHVSTQNTILNVLSTLRAHYCMPTYVHSI